MSNRSRQLKAFFAAAMLAAALAVTPRAEAAPFDHAPIDAILKEYVSAGRVDYQRLQQNRTALDQYVASLADVKPSDYESWDEPNKIAFWLNAYNAITMKIILDHYPIKRSGSLLARAFPANSIRQIPGQWDKIQHTVMDKPMVLNDIEHGTLRKLFKEPRVHMALVCAARGCPPLRSEAYEGSRLSDQLDDQARTYLANQEAGLRIDREEKAVALSSIFSWFGEDFLKAYGDPKELKGLGGKKGAVLAFVTRYLPPDDQALLRSGDVKIKFLDYDWTLNDKGL